MYETLKEKELCEVLNTDLKAGLTQEEAKKRLESQGENVLKKGREKTLWDMVQEQINDPMIFILFVAAAISMLLREFSDTGIILAVIFLNTGIGVIQEGKAVKALEALKKITAPEALVKREGVYRKIPASQLVTGDLVKVEAGDQVPADIRLTSVRGLSADESALTGESLPILKTSLPLSQGLPVAEQRNMLFMSSQIMKGSGEGIVTATGMDTELGKIADMINQATGEHTPLQKRLGDLGKILSITAVGFCMALFLLGLFKRSTRR